MSSVAILGGGVAGLWIAFKLAAAGLQTVLFESGTDLGSQSSSRLHGWLHSGNFYALHGVDVAEACARGYRQMIDLAPNSIESSCGAYVVTEDENRAKEYVGRCVELGRDPSEISVRELHTIEPSLKGNSVCAAFRTNDTAFSPSVVLRELATRAVGAGATIVCQSTVTDVATSGGAVRAVAVSAADGRSERFAFDFCVNAAGRSTADILKKFGITIGLKTFKSQLMVVSPSVIDSLVLSLDPMGANFVPHASKLVIGLNGDLHQLSSGDHPAVDESETQNIMRAAVRVAPGMASKCFRAAVWACSKTECVREGQFRNPGFALIDHTVHGVSNFITVLPGKFTLAPVLADSAVELIKHRLAVCEDVVPRCVAV